MAMPEEIKMDELSDDLKKYINTNYELVKLQAAERASVLGSGFISWAVIGFVVILFVFFLSLCAGFYLSYVLHNVYAGFVIVAGFYLLVGLVLVVWRKKLLEGPLREKIVRLIFSKN